MTASRSHVLSGCRVVIIVENLSYPQDRRVRHQAETLRDEGAIVTVLAPAEAGQCGEDVVSGVMVRRFPRGPEGGSAWGYVLEYAHAWWQVARLLRTLYRDEGFDVIHACTPPDLFFPLALWYRLNGVRFVFDHHDASPELFIAKGGSRLGPIYWGLRVAEWFSMRSADAIIASSEPLAYLARDRGGVTSDRVFLVRSGAKARIQSSDPAPSGDKPTIGFVGCMGRQDGLEYLFEAARHLWVDRGRRDIEWILIGDGPERSRVIQQFEGLGMSGAAQFPGFVSDEERLSALLARTTVCVTPDPVTAFNMTCAMAKVIDYVAAGRAQVAFPLPETRFLAGAAALFVSPNCGRALADGILTVLDQPERRRSMEEAAVARAPAVRWEVSIPSLVKAYERALGSTE